MNSTARLNEDPRGNLQLSIPPRCVSWLLVPSLKNNRMLSSFAFEFPISSPFDEERKAIKLKAIILLCDSKKRNNKYSPDSGCVSATLVSSTMIFHCR